MPFPIKIHTATLTGFVLNKPNPTAIGFPITGNQQKKARGAPHRSTLGLILLSIENFTCLSGNKKT